MSWIRWGSMMVDHCDACGRDKPKTMEDFLTASMGGALHSCDECGSCWYVYDNYEGFLSLHHGDDDFQLEYEDFRDEPWVYEGECKWKAEIESLVNKALAAGRQENP